MIAHPGFARLLGGWPGEKGSDCPRRYRPVRQLAIGEGDVTLEKRTGSRHGAGRAPFFLTLMRAGGLKFKRVEIEEVWEDEGGPR